MCGISGKINKKKIQDKKIKQLLLLMKNRGPNGQRFIHINNNKFNYYFFFSRLSILDLNDRSMQPFKFKNFILVFNGEIYNYLELKKELETYNYNFHTGSDTEVLIKAWDKWGKDCLKKLDGMWSFAILNTKTFETYISRDIFGEKPLYYSLSRNELIFGSQVNYIACLKNNKIKINYKKLKKFLFDGYKSINYDYDSYFVDIKKVPQSTYIKFNHDLRPLAQKYYEIKLQNKGRLKTNLLDEIKEEVKNSIKIRLRSDVKKSFLLSGGIDSNALIGISKKVFKEKINSYSILSSSKFHSENYFIKKGSRICDKVKYIDLENKTALLRNNFLKMQEFHFSPTPTLTSVLAFSLGKLIKKDNFKITYSGLGGDEMFTGYYIHYKLFLNNLKKKENKVLFNSWENTILPNLKNPYLRDPRTINSNTLNKYAFNTEISKRFFYNHKNLTKRTVKFKDKLKNDQFVGLFNEIVPVILDQDDINFMYHSIENRSPFLSKKILELAFKIPNNLNFKDGFAKFPLRQTMKQYVNKEIINNKKKIGFNTTINNITNTKSDSFIKNIFKSEFLKKYVNKDYLKDQISNDQTLLNSQQVFNIFSTSSFLNKFE